MAWLGKKSEDQIKRLKQEIERINSHTERQRDIARRKIDLIEKQIEGIRVEETPIKPGMVITWTVGRPAATSTRRGKVLSVNVSDRWGRSPSFEYRVRVMTKTGKEVGFQTVREDHGPVIETPVRKSRKTAAA